MPSGGSNILLTRDQTAAKLGISAKTLDRNWKTWGLRRIALTARAIRYRERDVEHFIESRSSAPDTMLVP